MESLKIFAILLLVALPLVSAAGDRDSRKRKDVGESSSQRPAKSTRQEPHPETPAHQYPGAEYIQTPQLEYDMPPGYDTDFTEQLRQGFAPQDPFLSEQVGGSSTHPAIPMSLAPLEHPGASSTPVDPSGAAGSSQQPVVVQSADMSSDELFHHWMRNYLMVFRPENPNIEPELFKSYLTQLKSFEQSAQFHDLYKQAEKSARPQQSERALLWDYVKEAKMLMQERLTLARKFKTTTDVLLQLFKWGENSCIPNDVSKLAQIQEKLSHHASVKRMLDYVKTNQQQDCDSRYKEVILNGEILLGQDTKEAARRMLELTARETIHQMMTNKNDPKLFKKIVDVLSLYLAQLDTAKFENFGVIEIDNPKIEYPKMYENEILNPCARICELNQIPYNYYVEYRAIADAQSSSGKRPMNEDLDTMIQKIEFCCFVHNKKPPTDEVKELYEAKKKAILAHQAQQEASGAAAQPAGEAGTQASAPETTQGGQPARLQVTLPSELMGSEAARIPARGSAPGPEREFTRPLSGVVIREPGEAQQQRPPEPAHTGAGKGVLAEENAQAILGRLHYQSDDMDPAIQSQLLAHYQQTGTHQQHRFEPDLQAQLLAPFGYNMDPQNIDQSDPNLLAALLAQYDHQQLMAQQQQQLQQHPLHAYVDPNQFAAQQSMHQQALHPDLHQQALHQQALHPDLHQQALHQQALHQQALHQQALHQQALHQQELHPDLHQQALHPDLTQQLHPQLQYDPLLLADLQKQYDQQMLAQFQQQLEIQHQSHPQAQVPPQPQDPQVHAPTHHQAQDPQQPRHPSHLDVSDSE